MFVQPVDVCVSPQLQPEQLDCGAAHLQHPLAIVNPVTATPIFTYSGLTAVAVASVNNYTVVFLGTASGGLLKASGAQQQHGAAWSSRVGDGLGVGAAPSSPSGLPRGGHLLSAWFEHLLLSGNEGVIAYCHNLERDTRCLMAGGC